MNRISHPDWVKLRVELNYAPNKNSFCYKSSNFFGAPERSLSNRTYTPIIQNGRYATCSRDKDGGRTYSGFGELVIFPNTIFFKATQMNYEILL